MKLIINNNKSNKLCNNNNLPENEESLDIKYVSHLTQNRTLFTTNLKNQYYNFLTSQFCVRSP